MKEVALVTMELQRGVVGDLAKLTDLRDAANQRGVPAACGSLASAARECGVPVVHCVVQWREDRRGTPLNTPLVRRLASVPDQILEGSGAVDLLPELGDTSRDLRSARYHAMAPFHGTDLDPLLRSLGVENLVVCGVSLNIGVLGLVIGAVDRGYEVTIASDAVVGVPVDYGDSVLRHTLAALARQATVAEVRSRWVTN
jgi:nicotinamidase-related amidase